MECQDLDCLTVKAIMVSCTTEIPLVEAYAGKTVISMQKDTLLYSKMGTEQNFINTNPEWWEWQDQDKIIAEVKICYGIGNWVNKKD